MNDDPADERAERRRRLQLSRELENPRKSLHHPSFGGTRGYPVWFRHLEIDRFRRGEPIVAHRDSLHRWLRRVILHRMCGNKEKTELVGLDLILPGVLSIIYLMSSQDEMVTFIYSEGGGVYSRQLILQCLAELDVTYKKVSMEAYAAFTPRNLRLF